MLDEIMLLGMGTFIATSQLLKLLQYLMIEYSSKYNNVYLFIFSLDRNGGFFQLSFS